MFWASGHLCTSDNGHASYALSCEELWHVLAHLVVSGAVLVIPCPVTVPHNKWLQQWYMRYSWLIFSVWQMENMRMHHFQMHKIWWNGGPSALCCIWTDEKTLEMPLAFAGVAFSRGAKICQKPMWHIIIGARG